MTGPAPAPRRRRTIPERIARSVPGVTALAALFARVARARVGRVRVGLLALLPVAVLIDLLDVGDELLGGPIGMALSFIVETAFVLGLTGRPSWALGGAGWDLLPVLDVLPVATITVLVELLRDVAPEEGAERHRPTGPVIDV